MSYLNLLFLGGYIILLPLNIFLQYYHKTHFGKWNPNKFCVLLSVCTIAITALIPVVLFVDQLDLWSFLNADSFDANYFETGYFSLLTACTITNLLDFVILLTFLLLKKAKSQKRKLRSKV